MFASFTPSARQTVVRAGTLAVEAGRGLLGTEFLLLALTEVHRFVPPLESFQVTSAAVGDEVRRRAGGIPPRPDRELLATLGIDLDEVRRRVADATSARLDDPALWQLRRSRVRPLRVELVGPTGDLLLSGHSRKVMEVARYYARRRRALVGGEDLLLGLLADGSDHPARILACLGVDLRRLWSDLQPWHAAA